MDTPRGSILEYSFVRPARSTYAAGLLVVIMSLTFIILAPIILKLLFTGSLIAMIPLAHAHKRYAELGEDSLVLRGGPRAKFEYADIAGTEIPGIELSGVLNVLRRAYYAVPGMEWNRPSVTLVLKRST